MIVDMENIVVDPNLEKAFEDRLGNMPVELKPIPANDLLLVQPGETPRAMLVLPTTHAIGYYTLFWAMRQGPKIAVRPYLHTRSGFVEDMRQKVVNLFLESGIDWLVMCDNDTIPSFPIERAISRAESIDAKVVAYPTPFISTYPGIASNLFIAAEDEETKSLVLGGVPWFDLPWNQKDENGSRMMFEIAGAGFGCTLIHRSVLSKLMKMAESGELTDYPMRAIWKNGELFYGEDQAFFIRVSGALDLPIHADLECWCSHHKTWLMNPNFVKDLFLGTNGIPGFGDKSGAPYQKDVWGHISRGKPLMDRVSIVEASGNKPGNIIVP